MKLRTVVEETDTRAGRVFDLAAQSLILISLVSFSIETLPDLSQRSRFWLYVIEVATVALFTVEYGLRILVAEKRLRFVFSFYGLVDLAAILPFYLSAGVDLRALRVVRLFRVFRAFKLLRYTQAIRRFQQAFADIRDELVVYFIATAFLVFFSSVGIYYFEGDAQPQHFGSIFHCLWWSVITLTTVGYGDAYPITVGGKCFASLVVIVGIGVVAVPTGLLASALSKTRAADCHESDDVRAPEANT